MRIDPESIAGQPLSYSYRARPETAAEVLWNRISVTAGLFTVAMASAFVLGRKR